jgi:glycosyltransferase involved in cell wall biosynthesis
MNVRQQKVSIGLPVYNGERFLAEAIESLLGQTYGDFELVISDNASTDSTGEICAAYARKDSRIRYYRTQHNIGCNPNFRRVFQLTSEEYFKWATHDDLHAPTFLEHIVAALNANPSIALCYARALMIDEAGNRLGERAYPLNLLDPELADPAERFWRVLDIDLGSPAVYGVFRRKFLEKTPLMGTTYAADQVLLAEVALRGMFCEIPEGLMLHREHDSRSVHENPTRHALVAWVEPSKRGKLTFPMWHRVGAYAAAIWRSSPDWRVAISCCIHLTRWMKYHSNQLGEDLVHAKRHIAGRMQPNAIPSHD